MGNLAKENFQVLDNGKPQVITGFTIVERAAEPSGAIVSSSAPNSYPNASQSPSPAQRFVVFLFDDLNLSTSDLNLAQKAVTKLLEASLPASDTIAVLSTSGTNSGFTSDRAKLQHAILNIKANNVYRYNPQSCPNVNYYTADLILDKRDAISRLPLRTPSPVQDSPATSRGSRQPHAWWNRQPSGLWQWDNKLIGPILASSGW